MELKHNYLRKLSFSANKRSGLSGWVPQLPTHFSPPGPPLQGAEVKSTGVEDRDVCSQNNKKGSIQ